PSWRRIQCQRKAAIRAWNKNKVSTASAVAVDVRAKASANSFHRSWGQNTQPTRTITRIFRTSSPTLVSNSTPRECTTCRCVKTCLSSKCKPYEPEPVLAASTHHFVREYVAREYVAV